MTGAGREAGRRLFDGDPTAYDRGRPPYPGRVFEVLRERCGPREGAATLEIGPGTGLAMRRLTALGARPLVAVEPDARLAAFLNKSPGTSSAGGSSAR